MFLSFANIYVNLCSKVTAGSFLRVAGCESDHDDSEEPGPERGYGGFGSAV